MPEPIKVDIPHHLGRETAKARIGGGIGKLADMVPGGGTVAHHWEGDTMHFTVSAMGQTVACRIDVLDASVHAEVDLPPMLGLFAGKIRDKLLSVAPKLLK
jgi:hypothetical protein